MGVLLSPHCLIRKLSSIVVWGSVENALGWVIKLGFAGKFMTEGRVVWESAESKTRERNGTGK